MTLGASDVKSEVDKNTETLSINEVKARDIQSIRKKKQIERAQEAIKSKFENNAS